jgi:hypothetical protein
VNIIQALGGPGDDLYWLGNEVTEARNLPRNLKVFGRKYEWRKYLTLFKRKFN